MELFDFISDYRETRRMKKKLDRLLAKGIDYNFLLKMIILSGQTDKMVVLTLANGEKIEIFKPDMVKTEKHYVNGSMWEPMMKDK